MTDEHAEIERLTAEVAFLKIEMKFRDGLLTAARAALREALPILEAECKATIEYGSKLRMNEKGEFEPVPGTLDPDCEEWVDAYNAAITAARAALEPTP